jgi:hypothetical protein
VDGIASSTFSYSIPKHSSKKFTSVGTSRTLLTGSVNVRPTDGTVTPAVQLVFALRTGGVTVTEGGIPVTPKGLAFRLYVESSGTTRDPGNIQTAIAIANTNPVSTTVKLELFQLDGSSTGIEPILVMLQPFETTSKFLSEYFGSLVLLNPGPDPFKGVVRISSNSEISILGLLTRFNERGEFLFTATLQSDENKPAPNGDGLIPQFADSGGYATQFILLSGSSGQSSSGLMRFFSQLGQPIILSLKQRPSRP